MDDPLNPDGRGTFRISKKIKSMNNEQSSDLHNLSQRPSRRDFLKKGSMVAFLSAIPGFAAKATTTPTPIPLPLPPGCNPNSPVLQELLRISTSRDTLALTEAIATIWTGPEMLSLPSYFLNTNADQLSGFQKDVLR